MLLSENNQQGHKQGHQNSGYNMKSRGYKTKGYTYKDRYIDDKICPECGGTSIYKDEWSTIISYKCIRRSCRYQWFENKNQVVDFTKEQDLKYEKIKIHEEEKRKQDYQYYVNDYLLNADLNKIDREDLTEYSLVGYREDKTVKVLGNHILFKDAVKLVEESNQDFEHFDIIEEKMIIQAPSDLFIVSNIESCYLEAKELLYRPVSLGETYIIAGNFVGDKNVTTCLKHLYSLKQKRPLIFLRGVQEHNIIEYVNGTENYIGDMKSVRGYLNKLEYDLGYSLHMLKTKQPNFYDMIINTKDYFENDTHIVVSGGIDFSIPFWRQSDKEHLYTTTDDFLNNKNTTGKVIVFGDKHVEELSDEKLYGIWRNAKSDKIGINGNCSDGGKLIGLSILNNVTNFVTVKNRKEKLHRLRQRYSDDEIIDFLS